MSLHITEKKAIVAEVTEVAQSSLSVLGAHYRGLTVEQMTGLRVAARKNNVHLQVVKNTLAKRALKDTEFELIEDRLVGPTILAFSSEAPGAAARLFRDFLKENDGLDKSMVQFVCLSGNVYESGDLDRVASLPTKDEALSLMLACMKEPLNKLARVLNEPTAKFVRTVKALEDQKRENGEA